PGPVDAKLRPLVQTTCDWHQAMEVDNDCSRRQIKQHEGEQPENDVRRPELPRHTDPREADDEEDLRESEIADAELLLQRRAVCLDVRLRPGESGRARGREIGRRVAAA